MERRSCSRQVVVCPVIFAGNQTISEGTLINLSVPGCAIQTRYAAKHGEYLKLRILIPGQPSAVAIEVAKVCWHRHGGVGVQFLRVQREEQQRLAGFLVTSRLQRAAL